MAGTYSVLAGPVTTPSPEGGCEAPKLTSQTKSSRQQSRHCQPQSTFPWPFLDLLARLAREACHSHQTSTASLSRPYQFPLAGGPSNSSSLCRNPGDAFQYQSLFLRSSTDSGFMYRQCSACSFTTLRPTRITITTAPRIAPVRNDRISMFIPSPEAGPSPAPGPRRRSGTPSRQSGAPVVG